MSASPVSRPRRLIVNADDFGQTAGVNEGIIRSCEQGVVTSASLMVRWPMAAAAAQYARAGGRLSVGLHLDLGEWAYRNDAWASLYEVVAADDHDAIAEEIERQLLLFRQLMGRDPTHLDSHQHVHRWDTVAGPLRALGETLGIPVRHTSPHVAYQGGFYGQTAKGESLPEAITVEHLIGMIERLGNDITELACHPGSGRDTDGMYAVEREQEVEVLCDKRVRAAIEARGLELISFADLSPVHNIRPI